MTNSGQGAVLRPGRNCWRISSAARASVLVDGDAYFAGLRDVLLQARRSIQIVGWDFDSRIILRPLDDNLSLGALLRASVEANPDLQVDILVWSVAVLHAPSSPKGLLLGNSWEDHPRIRLYLDTRHPIYAAHHQKIVIVDGVVAFCGGMDLTVWRWDTIDHRPNDPFRIDPDGSAYGPVHDIQMVVDGAVAEALSEIVAERFRRAGLPLPTIVPVNQALWPRGLAPDFNNVQIGIARTFPPCGEHCEIEEIAAQTQDALLAARTFIYIETQYATSPLVAKILAKRLSEKDGPDVFLIVTKESRGRAEQFIMGRNRERFLRRITRADRFGRLRIFYPAIVENGAEYPIHVHAKFLIVDDVLLRVGSANLNNRSMGLDTECDLTIEAHDENTRSAIREIRERLIGEHLGCEPEKVRNALIAERSILRGTDSLNGGRCRLVPVPVKRNGPIGPVLGTFLLDPPRPISPLRLLRRKLFGQGKPGAAAAE